MRLAEQPAVFSALTLGPQQIQVKGFSRDAIQARCQYLSLLCRFPAPKGDLVRNSWFEIVCDFVSSFGIVPTLVSEQQSLGWHDEGLLDALLPFSNTTMLSCILSNLFTYLVLDLEWSVPFTFNLKAPNHQVLLPSYSRPASTLKGMHLVNEKFQPKFFPTSNCSLEIEMHV